RKMGPPPTRPPTVMVPLQLNFTVSPAAALAITFRSVPGPPPGRLAVRPSRARVVHIRNASSLLPYGPVCTGWFCTWLQLFSGGGVAVVDTSPVRINPVPPRLVLTRSAQSWPADGALKK